MTASSRQVAIDDYIRRDPFSNHLGATVELIEPGHSRVSLTVTEEMANFHGITHGGVVFALGDMAFAAAGNSRGQKAVALNISLSYLKASTVGDQLVAEAREIQVGGRTGLYEVTIWEGKSGDLIAKSQNVIYRTREWFVSPEE